MVNFIRERRIHRFQLLIELYRQTGADPDQVVDLQEIASKQGMTPRYFKPAWKYLMMEELIQLRPYQDNSNVNSMSYWFTITHKGIRAVEEVFLDEYKHTYYFPSYREINI
jgi:predicted transcriptional regulator